jgi:alkanesulfonate monooxygenase SsuD/methylene tetrahydromethanopterin reductase-like flavin-dependent oxidoreductase (luciferase family)
MSAEKLGIPAVAVITDRFEQSARAMAGANGLPDYPFAIIAHPIAGNTDDDLRAKAEIAVREIVPLLLDRRSSSPP